MARVQIPYEPLPRKVGASSAWTKERGEVWVRCNCGKWLALDHDVAGDGAVSPSLVHEYEDGGCGWHVHAQLLGWPTEEEQSNE